MIDGEFVKSLIFILCNSLLTVHLSIRREDFSNDIIQEIYLTLMIETKINDILDFYPYKR